MERQCKPGDIVRYIRTGAIYLLLEEIELSKLINQYKKEGTGFRAIAIYSGRSYTKQGCEAKLFIPFKNHHYEVLSPGLVIL